MRTTIDLNPWVHRRLTDLARERGKTLSVVADNLLMEALTRRDMPEGVFIDPRTGLAKVRLDRQYTMEEIAELIDEDD
ncbi:MAG: hypothetical protein LBI33_06645 [Propionibacteriaceae bacterium]|nr:hypothetical protein [Propionibacteriaceae bacterium]